MPENNPAQKVLILDFGSQFTQLIARRVRELGFYSFILPGSASIARIREFQPKAVILSGGPSSVYEDQAPKVDASLFSEYVGKTPVLGICYGMQLLAHKLGGKVEPGTTREYGRMKVAMAAGKKVRALPSAITAWMSHGDEVVAAPPGFEFTYQSDSGTYAGMESSSSKAVAYQFHPEVTHTEHGKEVLKDFLVNFAGLKPDWNMSSLRTQLVEKIRSQVESGEHVICALSGGVDSTVAATLVHEAVGDRLHCVFVDHGLLRYKERERVVEMFKNNLHLPVTALDESARFLGKLAGVSDPEQKRKIIGTEFIRTFEDFAKSLEKTLGKKIKYLVQGTLYPDVIESSPPPSVTGSDGMKHSVTIKSHHNVGGLPKDLGFSLVEPLRDLFKDEVRALGKELKIPDTFLKRHPFPGPGLAVRILGEITPERIAILQKVDEVYLNTLREDGLYDQIWQAFAVFLPVRSVGVMGDGRTHDHVVGLRAVTSQDGMTADWFPFDAKSLAKISTKICNEVKGVNRVVYDVTSKPPATIEWE